MSSLQRKTKKKCSRYDINQGRERSLSFWLDDLLGPGDADVAEDRGDDRHREAAEYDLAPGEVPVEGAVP